jgi:tripeptide aminopeptidase
MRNRPIIPAKPSRERLTDLFVLLARIPSPSRSERDVADALTKILKRMGLVVHEDRAGKEVGGNCGNLWCSVGGSGSTPCLALGAHLDTVTPGATVEPVLDAEGVFRNSAPGILGADDKGAIAAMIHATELLLQAKAPIPPFELFFTVCEEQGLLGAKHFDKHTLRSPMAAVMDASGPVGGIVVRAPSQKVIRARFKGLAAHAGVEPERGRNAVVAAAKAIAAMRLGRLDSETTANIGVIKGGDATNVVPELCIVEGECRSHDEKKLVDVAGSMVDLIQGAAAGVGVDVEVDLVNEFESYSLDSQSPVVQLGERAVAALGLVPQLRTAGGGSDANVLNAWGTPTINLCTGMTHAHSNGESLALDELERLCELCLQMMVLAGQGSKSDGHVPQASSL